MTTLLVSSMSLPAAPPLADAAARRGWKTISLDRPIPRLGNRDRLIFYGSTLVAMDVATRFELALLEPPLDLLARLPPSLLMRTVEYSRWDQFHTLQQAVFIKPADPLDKVFDAGVYRERSQIRTIRPIPPDTPILLSQTVEWLTEYRCFVLDRDVVAWSPYLSFGRPLHHHNLTIPRIPPPQSVLDVCRRLFASIDLPPAFVVDVGLIEDCGWAIVEFNPAWCSGLLSADPDKVLDVLARSCGQERHVSDRKWIVTRSRHNS